MDLTIDGNYLVITKSDGKKVYMNASWCSLEFTSESVVIRDQGRAGNVGVKQEILFSEFSFDGGALSTEADIFNALKDVLG